MSAPRRRVSTGRLMAVGILVCVVLAGIVSYYASSRPDGLNFVANEKGFADSAGPHASDGSPFAGYSTRGIDDARLSGGVAGVVGGAIVFVIAGGLFLAIRRRDRSDTSSDSSSDAASRSSSDD